MTDSEFSLLTRCRQGRRDAWDELFERYYGLVCRFIAQMHPAFQHEDVEEIAQETFLAIVRGLGGFQGGSQFTTWVYRIAANKCRDYWEKQGTAKRGGGRVTVPLDPFPDASGGGVPGSSPQPVAAGLAPDQAAMRKERLTWVRRALDRLGDPCREILELRYFGDLCYEDIAKALDLNEKTVSSRLSRCLDALAEVVKGLEQAEGKQAAGQAGSFAV